MGDRRREVGVTRGGAKAGRARSAENVGVALDRKDSVSAKVGPRRTGDFHKLIPILDQALEVIVVELIDPLSSITIAISVNIF